MATVLLVDDSAVDRRLAAGILGKNSKLSIESAANGAEALAQIKRHLPDLVVTDLQMPEMDGLELVTAIRLDYPQVPVILMTAHGSETLAVEALKHGAASYVPKSELADMLSDTVDQILALTLSDRSYKRLTQCLTKTQFTFSLENDAALIDPLVDLVQQIIVGMGLCDANGRFRVGVALHHALLAAMYHGNLEVSFDQIQQDRENLILGQGISLIDERRTQPPYRDRKIRVDVQILPEEARFTIEHEGPGFDVETLPDPNDPSALEREEDRGLVLMRTFMDTVAYSDTGGKVTMVKRRDAREIKPPQPAIMM